MALEEIKKIIQLLENNNYEEFQSSFGKLIKKSTNLNLQQKYTIIMPINGVLMHRISGGPGKLQNQSNNNAEIKPDALFFIWSLINLLNCNVIIYSYMNETNHLKNIKKILDQKISFNHPNLAIILTRHAVSEFGIITNPGLFLTFPEVKKKFNIQKSTVIFLQPKKHTNFVENLTIKIDFRLHHLYSILKWIIFGLERQIKVPELIQIINENIEQNKSSQNSLSN